MPTSIQTKNKVYLASSIFALMIAVLSISSVVAAHGGPDSSHRSKYAEKGPHPIKQAIADSDFEAYQSILIEKGKTAEDISEERFNKMVEAHSLFAAGDKEGAKAIFKELKGDYDGEHKGKKYGHFRSGHHKNWHNQDSSEN